MPASVFSRGNNLVRIINLLNQLLKPVETAFAAVAGLVVIALMLMGCAEVIGRSAFNAPIRGNLDIVEQLMVLLAALGIAYCQRNFGNVRMTLLVALAQGRLKWLLEVFSLSIAVFVTGVLVKGSWANFLRVWTNGGDTPEIGIPLWIGILAVTAALALLLFRLVVQWMEALRLLVTPNATSIIFTEQSAAAPAEMYVKEEI